MWAYPSSDSYDAAIDLVIADCGDDPRAALKAMLIANDFLGTELERLRTATSTGYSRGRLPGDSKDKQAGLIRDTASTSSPLKI